MTVYIQTPFDNIPAECCRAMRYWNMTEAFVAVDHEVEFAGVHRWGLSRNRL